MIMLPRPEDGAHKAWLIRLLTAIIDHPKIGQWFAFKGGTCAAMRGFIDRFSLDLDFDLLLPKEEDMREVRISVEAIFRDLGFTIADQSKRVPQYFLKYPPVGKRIRNSLKIDMCYPVPKSNDYELIRLQEIDRIVKCQTVPTMFANKLIAVLGRYERRQHIASRDLYDIHAFFFQGLQYKKAIIEERTGKSCSAFFQELIAFIEKKVSQEEIDHGLNVLLPPPIFKRIRKTLKQETLMLLKNELKRTKK